jgi:hypothetical protein
MNMGMGMVTPWAYDSGMSVMYPPPTPYPGNEY